MADQSPELRRDYAKDRERAIKEQIAAYKRDGRDTSHLESLLKGKTVTGVTESMVALDVEPRLAPGELGPTVVCAPRPTQGPEPYDGSVPDKFDQDQSPKPVRGAGENVVTAKDPGPEAGKRVGSENRKNELPVQRSPEAVEVETVKAVRGPVVDEEVPALPTQHPRRGEDGDEPVVELQAVDVEGGGKSVGPIPVEAGADKASEGASGAAAQQTPKKSDTKSTDAKKADEKDDEKKAPTKGARGNAR